MNGLALKELARNLALVMHEGQCRKATGEPYFNHVERVAMAVKGWEAQTVAYLHDVVEDTRFSEQALRLIFPIHLCNAVMRLTRDPAKETYAEFIERVTSLPALPERALAIEVKIADVKDNFGSLDNIPGDTSTKEKRYTKALAKLLEARDG